MQRRAFLLTLETAAARIAIASAIATRFSLGAIGKVFIIHGEMTLGAPTERLGWRQLAAAGLRGLAGKLRHGHVTLGGPFTNTDKQPPANVRPRQKSNPLRRVLHPHSGKMATRCDSVPHICHLPILPRASWAGRH